MALPTGNRARGPELTELVEKYYALGVKRAREARTASQLVDLITRQHVYDRPALSYAEALRAALDSDPRLKKAYVES